MAERPVLIADAITAITSFTADARTTALAPTPVPSMRARSTRAMSCEVLPSPSRTSTCNTFAGRPTAWGSSAPPSEQPRRRSGGRTVDEGGEHIVGARRDRDDHRTRAPRSPRLGTFRRHRARRSGRSPSPPVALRRVGCRARSRFPHRRPVRRRRRGRAPVRRFDRRPAAPQPVQLPRRAPPPRSDARCRSSPRRTSGRRARAGGGHPCPPRG